MKRRILLLTLAIGLALPATASTSLAEAWLRVQQELSASTPESLDGRIQSLEQAAQEVDAQRLTPYAAALVAWARENPGEGGQAAIRHAERLDPRLPSVSFLLARWHWRNDSFLSAFGSYVAGWIDLFRNGEPRRLAALVGVLWVLLSVGVAVMLALVLQIAVYLRQMVHDANELGLLLFKRGNAIVFAVVVLLLPVFAALGPLWLVAYLFALSWPYMGRAQLAAAVVCCGVLSLLGPALEVWQEGALRVSPVITRVADMLEERRIDPSTLREFADLEQDLQGIARYELIMGELLRMHGDAASAYVAFQRAGVADPRDPAPLVFLGNLAMENGDVPRAIQQYTAAIGLDDRCAFAYHNLSFAYDQSYRFQEGDDVRQRARELEGQRRSSIGIPGKNPRIRYPRLGRDDVAAMMSKVTPEMRLTAALESSQVRPLGLLLSPLSAVFWVTGLIGAGVLVARSTRWKLKATRCARCGRVFCPRCKTSTESASYCSQCISVFLKRDVVSIEQQAAKMAKIRRWEVWASWSRRVLGALLPGSTAVLDGQVWLGLGLGILGWICLLGAVVFAPRFLPAIEPLASALPVQLLLLLGVAALWGRGLMTAWRR